MSEHKGLAYVSNQDDEELSRLMEELALEVLEECRKTLMMSFRFLDVALWHMPFEPLKTGFPLCTDGKKLGFHPSVVIQMFRADVNEMIRDYLHVIMHCIFQHPFADDRDDRAAWGTACDICVETTIIELCGTRYPSAGDGERMLIAEDLKRRAGSLIPHALYKVLYLGEAGVKNREAQGITSEDFRHIRELFYRDCHDPWVKEKVNDDVDEDGEHPKDVPDAERAEKDFDDNMGDMPLDGGDDAQDSGEGDAESPQGEEEGSTDGQPQEDGDEGEESGVPEEIPSQDDMEGEQSQGEDVEPDEVDEQAMQDALEEWKEIAKQIEADLESFSKMQGEGSAGLMNNLAIANRKPANYKEFLKRFATMAEDMVLNDDEFDYIFYTYGLERYGNMPLIEPLEYKESKRVREFIIALDTSGSCSGTLIKTFVTRTYDILKQSQGFGEEVNIHIVQCDNQIQSDTKITSVKDLEEYRDNFWVKGYGGTDFRPLFRYVDHMVELGEFQDLRGIIYFTDGLGTFPAHAPDYETAFVFVDDGTTKVQVPPWAMRVQMTEEEILQDSDNFSYRG